MQFQLDITVLKEGDSYAAYVPALDLSTHGDSLEDALKAGSEAASIFLEELKKMGTLEEVLLELGWHKVKNSEYPMAPPEVIHATKSIRVSCHA